MAASVGRTITKVVSSGVGNSTKAAHYKSQAAGHYSLGSSSGRNQVQRAQVASIQLPQIHADCGGIDLFLGGFSYINAEQFIELLKNIGSSAKSYAFMLALETVSPQIASNIKSLLDKVQKMNLANINSCEAAAALVGATVPRASSMGKHSCTLMSAQKGHLTDWVAGQKGCGEKGEARARVGRDMERDHPDTLPAHANVAWFVLSKHKGWTDGLKETVMSITGTVIVKGDTTETFPPKAIEDEFFEAFINGGTTEMYACSGNRCLTLNKVQRQIKTTETHFTKVKALINSIEQKVYEDEPLSDEEKLLIEDTQVPILKIINIMSAHQRNHTPMDIHTYAEIIANDVLTKHIRDILEVVQQLIKNLRGSQLDLMQLREYMKQVQMVEDKLRRRNAEVHSNVNQIFKIVEKAVLLEKSIYANMRSIVAE